MMNPGSKEAVEKGCTCAVMDNAHGKGIPGSETRPDGPHFYISCDCPLHGNENEN